MLGFSERYYARALEREPVRNFVKVPAPGNRGGGAKVRFRQAHTTTQRRLGSDTRLHRKRHPNRVPPPPPNESSPFRSIESDRCLVRHRWLMVVRLLFVLGGRRADANAHNLCGWMDERKKSITTLLCSYNSRCCSFKLDECLLSSRHPPISS